MLMEFLSETCVSKTDLQEKKIYSTDFTFSKSGLINQ